MTLVIHMIKRPLIIVIYFSCRHECKISVQSKKHGKYAQFLVIYCQGSFRETVGVWKRYSDFDKLSRRISHGPRNCSQVLVGMHPLVVEDVHDGEYMPNAITSW